ncbi:choice-of-anchor P family protein [Solihabitans fulvus]|nr:choice-of-anchor P family protein [Solihabitans fulvus]
MRITRRGGLVGLAAVAALLVGASPASAAPGDASAYAAKIQVTLLGQPAVTAGPFAEAKADGPTANSLATVHLPGILDTGVLNASASRDDQTGAVQSKASTADVRLTVLGALGAEGAGTRQGVGNNTVGAQLIEAECHATQQGVAGSTKLVGVDLGSLGSVDATPAANTTIQVSALGVDVARIVFNEQIHNADGSLTVNAVHVTLLGGVLGSIGSGDVILSSATCGPAGLPIPMASGAGLWLGLGLLGIAAAPAAVVINRRRRPASALAAEAD